MADGKLDDRVQPDDARTVLSDEAASERVASAFAFLGSKAGAGTTGQGGGQIATVVDSNDPFAFGRNLEGIAAGGRRSVTHRSTHVDHQRFRSPASTTACACSLSGGLCGAFRTSGQS